MEVLDILRFLWGTTVMGHIFIVAGASVATYAERSVAIRIEIMNEDNLEGACYVGRVASPGCSIDRLPGSRV